MMNPTTSASTLILEVEGLTKSFPLPDKNRLVILQDLSMHIETGAVVSVMGVSGSGKSTLLHLLGALDRPDCGRIVFNGEEVCDFKSRRLSRYRNREIGFVFQFHYLMPELTVLENVMAPALLDRFQKAEAEKEALSLLNRVGLQEKQAAMPHHLSGGEKQRAAIARALINHPRLLLADEPTGNLDWKTGMQVFELFRSLIREKGLTSVIVTHNPQIAALTDKSFLLQDGKLKPMKHGEG